MGNILEWNNYSLSFFTPQGEVEAVRQVSLSLGEGEILGLVGESGCGKSVLCKSVLGLLPRYARAKSGRVVLGGRDVTACPERELRRLRGTAAAMVFQDPMTSLNPTIPVGEQIAGAILRHERISRGEARRRALELMRLVEIREAETRFGMQPHFFSGGMRQRCVLAIALAGRPRVLFADEPTTALDVTVQTKILDLLLSIRERTGVAIVLVSHDLGVVARVADRVAVMYAGRLVEVGTAEEVFYDPCHPYTRGLLSALPANARKGEPLPSIPGMPPALIGLPPGDPFAPRNARAMAIDFEEDPPMFSVTPTHSAATWLLDPRAPKAPAGEGAAP